MNKTIYIAAPFFTPQQLATVMKIESMIDDVEKIDFYSPRMDGVLQDMTPELRAASYASVYQKNVDMIETCDAVLAVLDEKDTGTIWEMGYARGHHGHRNMTFGIYSFTSSPQTKSNVMLAQSTDGHISGFAELSAMLRLYAKEQFMPSPLRLIEQF
jgi:nucleoside 2-deoxyribosyltransferase